MLVMPALKGKAGLVQSLSDVQGQDDSTVDILAQKEWGLGSAARIHSALR